MPAKKLSRPRNGGSLYFYHIVKSIYEEVTVAGVLFAIFGLFQGPEADPFFNRAGISALVAGLVLLLDAIVRLISRIPYLDKYGKRVAFVVSVLFLNMIGYFVLFELGTHGLNFVDSVGFLNLWTVTAVSVLSLSGYLAARKLLGSLF